MRLTAVIQNEMIRHHSFEILQQSWQFMQSLGKRAKLNSKLMYRIAQQIAYWIISNEIMVYKQWIH